MRLNFKIPNMKFKKIKMDGDEIMKEIDVEKLKKEAEKNEFKPIKKRNEPYDHPNYKTVKEFFYKSSEKYADNPCILEKPDHKTPYQVKTYKEFREEVDALGTAIIKLLNLKDKRVIIIGENQYGWYLSYMALLCGAGMAVPVDKELPQNEIENLIKRSKADAIIYSAKLSEVIKKVKKDNQNVKYYIEMNSDKPLQGVDVGIKFLVQAGKNIIESGDKDFEKIEIEPEEFKVLIFTSGTTSNSKGVMICNRNLAANINCIPAYITLYPTDRLFSVLPLHHTYESTIGFLYPISQGASIAVCEGLKYIVPDLKESEPTAILAVPLLVENFYKKIMDSIKKSHKDKLVKSMMGITNALKAIGINCKRNVFKEIYANLGGKLRIIVSAAAPMDKNIAQWFTDLGIIFLQGYGLTETAPISALTPEYKTTVGSVGKAVVGADIIIDNPNENGEGEILIKSPTLMLGYYQDEAETNKAIRSDGYFHSGDVGYIDKDGFIYITGRSKNVIVTQNGKNIYPEEIEGLLQNIPEIKEVMVYGKEPSAEDNKGKNDKELIITARIIVDNDYIKEKYGEKTEEEIHDIIWDKIKEVNKKLTSYKYIKKLEIKHDEFEKTSTMKIKRYKEISK